ncbi:hypothetical protein [Marinoscillum sp.]|uniref:hypothetical protein n=1 Tax=Marinoscillum sp. TaxID=2024838 RepID=UPI003BA9C3C0
MKNPVLLLALVLVTLAQFSCSEDPDDVNVVEQKGMLTVDISGTSTINFEDDTLTAYTHAGLFIVKASDAAENNIWIMMDMTKIDNMIGEHAVATTGAEVQINFNLGDASHYYSASSGVVTVTEYDEKFIKGTFSFEAKDASDSKATVSGANGQFSSSIQ